MKLLRALGRGIRSFWLMLGITLALIVVAECALGLIYRARDNRPSLTESKASSDVFAHSPWITDFFNEDHASAILDWHSYVYWRLRPYHGRYINVDENGIRRTWQSPDSAAADAVDIFVLGGSTTWGSGTRDDHTVPSELSRLLHERGIKARVTNFGENGYVSMQELITLELQLRQGHIPDLVIFYDGVNDTYSAWQQGEAGIPQNEHTRVVEFNMSNPKRRAQRTQLLLKEYASKMALRRFADSVVKRIVPKKREFVSGFREPGTVPLPQAVVSTYEGHMDLVRALANTYGFKYMFFWQPNLFEKKSLTKSEQEQADLMKTEGDFFRRTDELVRASGLEEKSGGRFHNISTTFTDETKPVYFDFCHMGEEGNHVVASHMIDDVVKTLSSPAPARP